MRILWFSVTPSMFSPHSNGHNGGGWIASLERIVRQVPEIKLGVAFNYPKGEFRYVKEGVTYYPITSSNIDTYQKIFKDFKPDLIQIFGSENAFGELCGKTDIPIVIHIQGCLPPYHNAIFPVGMSPIDFLTQRGLSWRYRFIGLRSESAFRKNAEREIETIKNCKYFMGRTEWDRGLIDLFNPNARYFHCEEALRQSFMEGNTLWHWPKEEGRMKIVSVISRPWYKGCDLILKTAQLLRRFTQIDIEWRVYGIPEMKFFEHKYGIQADKVGVRVMGTASQEELVEAITNSHCYVHTSYIDNSPNSLCEAQILGAPVLATHVGGISSLVNHGVSGLLFPANDPYTLASLLKRMVSDRPLAEKIGEGARNEALHKHDPESIKNTLVKIYEEILRQ